MATRAVKPDDDRTGARAGRETVDVETGEVAHCAVVLMLLELKHRAVIHESLMHFRRSRLRYRPARFNNRRRPGGGLAPSLQHRVDTAMMGEKTEAVPVTAISQDLVCLDLQTKFRVLRADVQFGRTPQSSWRVLSAHRPTAPAGAASPARYHPHLLACRGPH